MQKKHISFSLVISLGSLLIIHNVLAIPSFIPSSQKLIAQTNQELSQKAQAITVRVYAGNSSGSGVLIGKKGQTYIVITNAHVVERGQSYGIQTPDGITHTATLQTSEDAITGNDLALLEFQSTNSYTLATLASPESLTPNQSVYAAGFPYDSAQLAFSEGKISLISPKTLVGGYQIGFTNLTQQGMSGGVLLNQNGQLIGILGKGNAILANAYEYQDGTTPDEATKKQLQQMSFAIPSEPVNFLTKLYTNEGAEANIPRQVNQIAEQITVRIDRPNTTENGSGVIVGRNGETYYVLTARHVAEGFTELKIITPDGQTHQLQKDGIKTFEKTDLALLKFTSTKLYQVATLADYPIGQYDRQKDTWDSPLMFISGFPVVKSGSITRKFSVGLVHSKALNTILTKDNFSLSQQTELVYSCLSLRGMSGGAVLDHQGRVIGINTGAEDERMENVKQEEIHLGSSLGVPVKVFLGQLLREKINQKWFKIQTKAPTTLSKEQIKQIQLTLFTEKLPTESSTAAEWLNYGRAQDRLGQYDKAIEAYNQAIKRDPQFYQAYYLKGKSLDSNDKGTEALTTLEKATEINPKFTLAWYWKARVLRTLKKYPESLIAIDRAIQITPLDDAKLYQWRGRILVDLNRDPEAEEALSESIKLNPNFFSYSLRAYVLSFSNRQRSYNDYTKAIEIQPNYSKLYLGRAEVADLSVALKDLETAIQLNPDWGTPYFIRSNFRYLLGDIQGQIADLTKVIDNPTQIEPESLIGAYNLRGLAYGQLNQWDKAISDQTKCIELSPKNASYYKSRASDYYRRALTYSISGDMERALADLNLSIADLNKSIEIEPDNPDFYFFRGLFLIDKEKFKADNQKAEIEKLKGDDEKGDFQKAEELFTKEIQQSPENPLLYSFRGAARKKLGKTQEAEEDFQKSNQLKSNIKILSKVNFYNDRGKPQQAFYTKEIEANPRNFQLYFYRGIIVYALEDYQAALEDFNHSLQLKADQPETYYRRGLTYQSLQKYPQALADYNKALELKIFEDTDVYVKRGLVKGELADYPGAISDFNLVIQREPEWAELYFDRGVTYQKQGNNEAALADYNKAIALLPKLFPAIVNIGYIFYEKGDVESALKQWQTAIDINSQPTEPVFALAVALYAKGEQAKGLELAKKALVLDKSWANIDTLKRNLWGNLLIADAQKLLQNPEITTLVKK